MVKLNQLDTTTQSNITGSAAHSNVTGDPHSTLDRVDTFAELNTQISDATLIETSDARLSDARTPLAHTHDASDITAGTFADALISAGNVTQHTASIDHNSLSNYSASEHLDWTQAGEGTIDQSNISITFQKVYDDGPSSGAFAINDSAKGGFGASTTSDISAIAAGKVRSAISGLVNSGGVAYSALDATVLGTGKTTEGVITGANSNASNLVTAFKLTNSADRPDIHFSSGKTAIPTTGGEGTFGYVAGSINRLYVDNGTAQKQLAYTDDTWAASDITSGTFADALIAASNVTQHQASIDHNSLSNYSASEHIDWTQGAAGTIPSSNLSSDVVLDSNTTFVANTNHSNSTANPHTVGLTQAYDSNNTITVTAAGGSVRLETTEAVQLLQFSGGNTTSSRADIRLTNITVLPANVAEGDFGYAGGALGNVLYWHNGTQLKAVAATDQIVDSLQIAYNGGRTMAATRNDGGVTISTNETGLGFLFNTNVLNGGDALGLWGANAADGSLLRLLQMSTSGTTVTTGRLALFENGASTAAGAINAGGALVSIENLAAGTLAAGAVGILSLANSNASMAFPLLNLSNSGDRPDLQMTVKAAIPTSNGEGSFGYVGGAINRPYVDNGTSQKQIAYTDDAPAAHTHAASDITSGTFADALIASSNVTQHQASIDHNSLSNYSASEHIDWTQSGAGTIDPSNLAGGNASALIVDVQKGSAGTINAGEVVYISGYDVGASVPEVELADSDAAGTMPAFGMAITSITNSVTGQVVTSGRVTGIDTSAFAAGAEVYVSGTAGDLTTTKPTGTALIQKFGQVLRSHATLGTLEVFGAGRSNDLPNLPDGSVWLGNATATPTATNLSTTIANNSTVKDGLGMKLHVTSFLPTANPATEGAISVMPVFLFGDGANEDVVVGFEIPSDFDNTVNPTLEFGLYSTASAPGATEGVVFNAAMRYIAVNEGPGKAVDETVVVTVDPLPNLVANEKQQQMTFTLNGALMAAGDTCFMTLTRNTGAAADDYPDDAGVTRGCVFSYQRT